MGFFQKLSQFFLDKRNMKHQRDLLAQDLEARDASVRADAAVALAQLGDKRGINYLKNALEKRLGSRTFFLKVQEDLLTVRDRYLNQNVPHPVIMNETSLVAANSMSEFNELSMEEKAEFIQLLNDWLDHEMRESNRSRALEPFASFDIALQFGANLHPAIFVEVLIQYTNSFLGTGKYLIPENTPMMHGVAKGIVDNLTGLESRLRTNPAQNKDLLEWIRHKKEELLAYF